MDKILIKGIDAYDGEWDFDSSYFTNRELHTIKRVAGVRAGELSDALAAGDTDMIVALAVVALQRHGKHVDEDLLWDGHAGSILYEGEPEDEEEGDALPPVTGPAATSETGGNETSSGGNGKSGSESNPGRRASTGTAT